MRNAGISPEQATHIARFAAVANRYCVFVEQDPLPEVQAFVLQAADLLTELYGAALPLLPMQLSAETTPDKPVLREQTAEMRRRIGNLLAEQSLYWEVFDPYKLDEPVAQTLDDDLADIYHDLKEGLLLSPSTDAAAIEEAAWEWRFGLLYHWGDHLTDALRALHRILCTLHNG